MLVKPARRYIDTLDKILKNQHNDIITKITEYKDYYISYIKLDFHIEGRYCYVAYNDNDTVLYYVEGSNDVIEYIISDRETQKESMYKIINKIYDLVVTLSTETSETSKIEEATEDYNEYEEILDSKESTEHDRINYLMETHSTPTINFEYRNLMYTDEYKAVHPEHNEMSLPCRVCTHFCTRTDTDNYTFEYCCRKNKENEKKAIKNLEWHHVSLSTLANIDFDMLDEKRQTYFTVYREMQETLSRLKKCKTIASYDKCYMYFMRRKNTMWARGKISNEMWHYIEAKLSMQNVESGVWCSYNEQSTGYHKSRRYNKNRVDA